MADQSLQKAGNAGRSSHRKGLSIPQSPWADEAGHIAESLRVDTQSGLSSKEAEKRLEWFGENRTRREKKRSVFRIFLDQFTNLIAALLVGAAVLSAVFGHTLDAVAVTAALLLNAAIGFFTEWRASRSMEAFEDMTRKARAQVRRDGQDKDMAAEKLVPGDVVIIRAGDVLVADGRVLDAAGLCVDESALTGESIAVEKHSHAIDEDRPLAEQSNMLFAGTSVTSGHGTALVCATGQDTEIGRVATLTRQASPEKSPLEKRLGTLANRLVYLTLGIAAALAIMGLLTEKPILLVIKTSIALAVAAIPEGLPMVATLAMARGMWRMSKKKALVRKLSAVEALGSAQVVFTDKTGTLTENRMQVTRICLPLPSGKPVTLDMEEALDGKTTAAENSLSLLFTAGALANEAKEDASGKGVDPMDHALVLAAKRAGLEKGKLLQKFPKQKQIPFEKEVKMTASIHEAQGGGFQIFVKGAPEAVIEKTVKVLGVTKGDTDLSQWQEASEEIARSGLRVLAMARKHADSKEEDPFSGLELLGFVGLSDPAREQVPKAIESCQKAGIRVVMITGDHPATAADIARQVGIKGHSPEKIFSGKDIDRKIKNNPDDRHEVLSEAGVFARVSPEHKLLLVEAYQEEGLVTAMIGDGVNDAPALKKADIGVAMGKRSTQVARDAADVVLTDGAFSTIVPAIAHSRAIFSNIRKFVVYLLSGNVGEIFIVAGAMVLGWPLPLLPLQILYLNLIGDVFPALALGLSPESGTEMQQAPRKADEPLVTRNSWAEIFGFGAVIAICVLLTFRLVLDMPEMQGDQPVTVAFLTLSFARLWHVFNMRSPKSGLFSNEVTKNPLIYAALILCTGLLLLGTYVPWLAAILSLSPPDAHTWLFIFSASLIPLAVGQAFCAFRKKCREIF